MERKLIDETETEHIGRVGASTGRRDVDRRRLRRQGHGEDEPRIRARGRAREGWAPLVRPGSTRSLVGLASREGWQGTWYRVSCPGRRARRHPDRANRRRRGGGPGRR